MTVNYITYRLSIAPYNSDMIPDNKGMRGRYEKAIN
jgi:hypothetical protein